MLVKAEPIFTMVLLLTSKVDNFFKAWNAFSWDSGTSGDTQNFDSCNDSNRNHQYVGASNFPCCSTIRQYDRGAYCFSCIVWFGNDGSFMVRLVALWVYRCHKWIRNRYCFHSSIYFYNAHLCIYWRCDQVTLIFC